MKNLADVRSFIARESARLDPNSRYIAELLQAVERSADVADLEARLDRDSRGRYWAGESAFANMSLEEKLRANLITNETCLMRFDEPELAYLRETVLPDLKTRNGARILSLPCSHGEEAVSIAIECLRSGISEFLVHGKDVQPACVEAAKSGRIPYQGLSPYVTGQVSPEVMSHLSFSVADVFADDIGSGYDLIVCRNFLGYFTPQVIAETARKLANALPFDAVGYLLVDPFVLRKHPEAFYDLPLQRVRDERVRGLPLFTTDLD
ncbi:MAG TPA: CheR family methyltransferase [Candidatus Eisenbacteria bacterium]|jgi:chemotaxis methyl-accepting protein methylase|nr:CheR family methyltransferase [Candidatus Eisenbacteria bacterium]